MSPQKLQWVVSRNSNFQNQSIRTENATAIEDGRTYCDKNQSDAWYEYKYESDYINSKQVDFNKFNSSLYLNLSRF